MYKIKDYSYKKAAKLGVLITPSNYKGKKIDIYTKKQKFICSIGDIKYKDFPTYIEEKGIEYAKKRQKLYKIRHEKTRKIKNSASYYADNILW